MGTNKEKAFEIFSQDNECMEDKYEDTGKENEFGTIYNIEKITRLKKSDVEFKKDVFCFICGHKSVWGVKAECDFQPEWTYWCSNCNKKLIMVDEEN